MISLARSLFLHGKITTTEAKAKELSPFAQKIITRSKKESLVYRRFLVGCFGVKVSKKLIEETAPKYKDRKGGYTRIIKLPPRKLDGAKMAIIELV